MIGNTAVLLALTLIATAAQAEDELVTIYGSLRPEMIVRAPEDGARARRMDDGYSRVGVKGATELGGRLYGFYKYERRVSANDGEDDGAVRADAGDVRYAILSGEHRFSPQLLAFAEFFLRVSEVARPDDESAWIAGFRVDF